MILAICILILSVIPVVAIGPYLHQFADDYVYSELLSIKGLV